MLMQRQVAESALIKCCFNVVSLLGILVCIYADVLHYTKMHLIKVYEPDSVKTGLNDIEMKIQTTAITL